MTVENLLFVGVVFIIINGKKKKKKRKVDLIKFRLLKIQRYAIYDIEI